jgi:hypothetical protein
MPTLHCELGNHSWEREAKRGRVPKSCPDCLKENNLWPIHKNVKITSNSKDHKEEKSSVDLEQILPGISEFLAQDKMETLVCEVGNHTWERESRRGKKPKRCPEHSSEINSKSLPADSTARTQDLIAEILSTPRAASCHCGLTVETSPAEIRAMESCCSPQFICPTLDTVRRRLNL